MTPTTPNILTYITVSDDAKTEVNINKQLEEVILRRIEEIENNQNLAVDRRSTAIVKTEIQTAFMWLNRGIFKPQRIEL